MVIKNVLKSDFFVGILYERDIERNVVATKESVLRSKSIEFPDRLVEGRSTDESFLGKSMNSLCFRRNSRFGVNVA
jgi:hypothetical protein